MAVAGIVLTVALGHQSEVAEALKGVSGVVEVQPVEAIKVAAVVESPSDRLQADLEAANGLDHVVQLDVIYVNYEEDMDSEGHMPCPAHCGRRRKREEGEA
jgi:nitrate reductase NapD